eukprot:TRINITY_DN5660_c1_g1_i1.p1 TRINITY_DN5660_c1_g1~~TRINITY_DN5660_c1_g1_i1.p1  ORF type:complete len:144 (+),score=23.99 TRINITY_DN5660_c1_g1_i1:65-496(+)
MGGQLLALCVLHTCTAGMYNSAPIPMVQATLASQVVRMPPLAPVMDPMGQYDDFGGLRLWRGASGLLSKLCYSRTVRAALDLPYSGYMFEMLQVTQTRVQCNVGSIVGTSRVVAMPIAADDQSTERVNYFLSGAIHEALLPFE